VTPADFKTRFPEFASETDQRVQLFINDALPLLDQARWDDLYDVGLANLVAHELSLANTNVLVGGVGTAGDETSVSVGDVSIDRGADLVKMEMEDTYYKTSYGQRFRKYQRLVGGGGVAV